jgi:poly-gamma-glutamate capsule biosynthesis protein CapA/YwtB (metallophosphatase superfamily)
VEGTSLPLVVAAVGDVMLGSTFPDESKGSLLPPDDGRGLLDEVAPLLVAADVAFGNLEGPLLDGGTSEKCARSRPGRCYAFRVPARYGAHLERAGFNVLSLANNHAGDFGDEGRASTRAVLERHGIRYAGAPGEVARLEVRGLRVAMVAFSTSAGTNDLRDLAGVRRTVEAAAAEADVVLVSVHGGAEGRDAEHVPAGPETFLGEDRGDLRAFARASVEAGADLVLGHGPHVVRGMEVIGGRLVAYSLGNFATWGGMNLSGPNGLTLVLEVRLAPDGAFLGGRIHPGRQTKPGGPRLDPGGEVIGKVRRLSREDFGPSAVLVADDGTLEPPPPAVPGASSAGQIGRERPRLDPSVEGEELAGEQGGAAPGGALAAERRVDLPPVPGPMLVPAGERHHRACDPAPAAVEEDDGVAAHALDDSDVREALVEPTVAVPIVGVVEEDQVPGERAHAGPEGPAVSLQGAVGGRHRAPLAGRRALHERPQRDPLGLVDGLDVSRAVRVEAALPRLEGTPLAQQGGGPSGQPLGQVAPPGGPRRRPGAGQERGERQQNGGAGHLLTLERAPPASKGRPGGRVCSGFAFGWPEVS